MKNFMGNIVSLLKKCHPVEFAARLHNEFVAIHPCIDGNGRIARLLMNLALFQSRHVVIIILPVVKNDYINAIKKSQNTNDNDDLFINFISCMVYESIKDYLRMLELLK
jgi:Fic family protein